MLNNNDHRKTIVHQVIRAIRDYIGIEPEKYLQYLTRRGIEPSPELLKQIRGKDSRYEYYYEVVQYYVLYVWHLTTKI